MTTNTIRFFIDLNDLLAITTPQSNKELKQNGRYFLDINRRLTTIFSYLLETCIDKKIDTNAIKIVFLADDKLYEKEVLITRFTPQGYSPSYHNAMPYKKLESTLQNSAFKPFLFATADIISTQSIGDLPETENDFIILYSSAESIYNNFIRKFGLSFLFMQCFQAGAIDAEDLEPLEQLSCD